MKRFSLLSVAGMETASEVLNVTRGEAAGNLAICGSTILNVYTGEYLEHLSVVVQGEWIAYIGEKPENRIGPHTHVIDAQGKTVIPGLIDGHSHLSDFLYSPAEFLRHAMTGGTTTIITELIEPFPIGGYEGLADYLDALSDQPIKILGMAPAMASTSREAQGIPRESLKKLIERDDIIGLGESYWSSVLQAPQDFLPSFKETLEHGKKLEGHSAGAKGARLMAYAAPGISSCHEPVNAEEVLERLRLGLHVMIREGSIRRDLADIAAIRNRAIDTRRLILVTDGMDSKDLLKSGYMEGVVQKAVQLGFDPVQAVQMATINAADYFQLDGIIGGISPGRYADMVVIPRPENIEAEYVISKGRVIARNGDLMVQPRPHTFSGVSLNTVHFKNRLEPPDFTICCDGDRAETVAVRTIELITDLVTRERVIHMPVRNGKISCDTGNDILKVAAIDRKYDPGRKFVGLIRGFHLKEGAIACSSPWDTANIIVVGANEEDMANAVNRIYELQGGAVFSTGGRVLAEIPMPVFGLISEMSMETLSERIDQLSKVAAERGFPFKDPIQTLKTLTGAAIPFLRICEYGLVDIKTGRTLPVIMDQE